MCPTNHLDRLLQLLPAAAVLVNGHLEDESPFAQVLEALDELVLQHGAVRLVLQEVPKPLDLGPRLAGLLLDARNVALHNRLSAWHGGPGHNGQTEALVFRRVAFAVERRAEGHALQPADLLEGAIPAGLGGVTARRDGREVVFAVCLDEDEAQQGGRGARGVLELLDGELARQRVVGRAPGEVGDFGLGVDVDVRVDDGEDEAVFVRHGGGELGLSVRDGCR